MLVAHSKFADAVIALRQLRFRRNLTVGVAVVFASSAALCWWGYSFLPDTVQMVLGGVAGFAFVVLVLAGLEWRKHSRIVSSERADGHIRRVGSMTRRRLEKASRTSGFVPSADDFFELQRTADHAQLDWISERRAGLDAMRERL